MGGIFHYDKDSGIGYYIEDKDIIEGSAFLMKGIGALAIVYLIGCIIGLAVISPFITLFVLDDFVETFIANNTLFFLGIGMVVVALKLLPKTTALRSVRVIFDGYILIAVLYFGLYILHFDVGVYTWFRIADQYVPAEFDRSLLDAISTLLPVDIVEANWFYSLAHSGAEKFIDFLNWSVTNITNIDNSSLLVPAAEMNILAVLKTVVLYIGIGGFSIICILLVAVLLFMVIVVTVAAPYVMAVVAVLVCNKLIYKLHTARIRTRGTEASRKERLAPMKEEFDHALKEIARFNSMEREFSLAQELAKKGNAYAQMRLAQCYLHGEGTYYDEKAAFQWYRKAALQGVPKAQMMVAFSYFDGIGVKKNKLLARAWLHATLKNKDFIARQRDKQNVMEKIARVYKKTRYSDCV